jgi:hypothetical protein
MGPAGTPQVTKDLQTNENDHVVTLLAQIAAVIDLPE